MGIDTAKQTHNEEGEGNSKQKKWHEFLPICGGEDLKETVLFLKKETVTRRERAQSHLLKSSGIRLHLFS